MKNRLRARSVCMASAATLALSLVGGTAFAAKDPGVAQPGVGPAAVAGATTYRLAGADRYDTAIAISQKWFNTTAHPKTVYVASGENFPDALAAAPIAGMNRAPVLLTPASAVPQKVLDEIKRLGPNRVVVVGGEGAVSAKAFSQLSGTASTVERVAGSDRYATSRAVIKDGMITNPDFAVTKKDLAPLVEAVCTEVTGVYQAGLTQTTKYKNAETAADGHSAKPTFAYTALQKEAIKNVQANCLDQFGPQVVKLVPTLRTAANMTKAKVDVNAWILEKLTEEQWANPVGGNITPAMIYSTLPTVVPGATGGIAGTLAADSPYVPGSAAGVPKVKAGDVLDSSGAKVAKTADVWSSQSVSGNRNPAPGTITLGNVVTSPVPRADYYWLTRPCLIKNAKATPDTAWGATKKDCQPLNDIYAKASAALGVFFSAKEEKALKVLQSDKHEALSFYFATGSNFPDALSIGAIAGNWYGGQPGPVFLEYGTATSVSDENRRLMNDLAQMYSVNFRENKSLGATGEEGTFRTYVIGGTGVMSDAMQTSISSVKYSETQTAGNYLVNTKIVSDGKAVRIGGKDRYETSTMIVNDLKVAYEANAARQGVLATGTNFPDALAGSAYAAASNSALWVTPGTCVTAGIGASATKLGITQFALLGGIGALSEPVDTLASCE